MSDEGQGDGSAPLPLQVMMHECGVSLYPGKLVPVKPEHMPPTIDGYPFLAIVGDPLTTADGIVTHVKCGEPVHRARILSTSVN